MFERQDWELFRTIDGLSHKAGVPREKIAALIAKELADNALDDSTACKVGLLDGDGSLHKCQIYSQSRGL